MISVKFKNLEKSELAREAATERMEGLVEKFPDLTSSKIQVTLEMENSPLQAGPDLFKVKVHISRGRYEGITYEACDSNLYVALAETVDHLLEILNRHGDRERVKRIRQARTFSKLVKLRKEAEGENEKDEQKIG